MWALDHYDQQNIEHKLRKAVLFNAVPVKKNLPLNQLYRKCNENDTFQRLSEVMMENFGEWQYLKHWLIEAFDNVNGLSWVLSSRINYLCDSYSHIIYDWLIPVIISVAKTTFLTHTINLKNLKWCIYLHISGEEASKTEL